MWKKHVWKEFRKLQGPACFDRCLCNNSDDFLTVEEMKDINYYLFFSFKDTDGFIYGFNLMSLYKLLKGKNISNPYNRKFLSSDILYSIKRRLNLNKIIGIPVDKLYKEFCNEDDISEEKMIENQVLSVCQQLDSHGYYSKPSWFNDLSVPKLKSFIYELMDIWNYRAQLSVQVKLELCKPHGSPFIGVDVGFINTNFSDKKYILRRALIIVNNLLQENIQNSTSNKSMCAMYVLTALSMVNTEVAETFPWLYQSVV